MTNEEITNGFINLYNFLGAAIEKNNGIKPEKKFEIDKPGVYEDDAGRIIMFSTIEQFRKGHLVGFMTNDEGLVFQSFYMCNGSHNVVGEPSIKKFISSTWNFEKGEPV